MFSLVSHYRVRPSKASKASQAVTFARSLKSSTLSLSPSPLCSLCLITKSVSHRHHLSGLSFLRVSSNTSNVLLFDILLSGIGSVGSSVTVLSSGGRYRVTVLSHTPNSCLLLQQYLHLASSHRRSSLQPVSFRHVRLIF